LGVESLESRTLLAVAPAGTEFRVNTTTLNSQENPAVAMDANGDSVVAWVTSDGTGVYAQRYDAAGQPLGGEFRTATAGTMPAVAAEADGDFIVAWVNGGVHALRYDAAGQPLGGEFTVSAPAAGNESFPLVATDAAGDFVVAWKYWAGEGTSEYGISARRYDAAGRPFGEEFKVGGAAPTGFGPSLASDAAGDFVIAWTGGDAPTGYSDVRARRYDAAGQPLGDAFPLYIGPRGADPPAVAMDRGGDFIIAWTWFGGSSTDIYARRYDAAGRPLGEAFLVTPNPGLQSYPAVAADADGDFVIAWHNQDAGGPSSSVNARRYSASGAPLGGEFRVNTTTAGFHARPSVASDAAGDFIIAWARQDDSESDIYAQRYQVVSDPASVGDLVWNDIDGDGIRESNEPGAEGVTVRLFTAAGTLADSTVTSGGGFYRFDSLRPGDSYYLEFVLPAGLLFAEPDRGGDDAVDSDPDPRTGRTPDFTLAAGQVDLTRYAGWLYPASIAGVQFHDLDRDGVRDPGEAGLNGWVIYLDADADGRLDPGERSTTTDWNGRYRFDALRPGSYRVAEVPRDAWHGTLPGGGAREVALVPGRDATGIDFGASTAPPDATVGPWPLGPEFRVDAVNPTYSPRESDVGVAADGAFVVVWTSYGQDGSYFGVYARRYDAAGRPLGDPFLVNTTTLGTQKTPAVAVEPDGEFVVVWESHDDGRGPGIYARRYGAAGEPLGEEFLVSAPGGGVVIQSNSPEVQLPAVAADAGGDFVVAWVDIPEGGGPHHVFAKRFDPAGKPVGGTFHVGDSYARPSVAMDADGDFVVGWSAPAYEVYARRYSAAAEPQGEPIRVTFGRSPAVAMDAGGNFVVASHALKPSWLYYDDAAVDTGGAEPGLNVFRYSAAGLPLGPGVRVDTTKASPFVPPDVAMDGGGDYVVTWTSGEGYSPEEDAAYRTPRGDIYARRFDAAGRPLGSEFRVNTTASNTSEDPAPAEVAMDADGEFVVAWHNDNGVFARRYGRSPAPRVAGVFVGGTQWTAAFRQSLAAQGLGEAAYGYEVAPGPAQLVVVPWSDVNQVSVRFTEPVVAAADDLSPAGLGLSDGRVTAYDYDEATHTATWTLDRPLAGGRLTVALDAGEGGVKDATDLRLDGEWDDADSWVSGDGAAGGDFRFRINVLPGDTTRDGRVNALDLADVKRRLGRRPGDGVTGGAAYSVFADVTADGVISALDLAAARQHLGGSIPAAAAATALLWG
jgi:hypothetical protein